MTRRNRIQESVSESGFTFPVCVAVSVALWLLPQHGITVNAILGWGLCLLTAYVLMGADLALGLIRIRTDMVSCVWVALAAALPFMHALDKPSVCAFCLSVSHLMLMRCYELRRPQNYVYHSFLFLSLGSLLSPVMFIMGLLFYFYLSVFLRALTWKGFLASVLGFATPYWCWFAYCLLTNNADALPDMRQVSAFLPSLAEGYAALPWAYRIAWLYVAIVAAFSIVHFLRNSYNDKIQVRMLMYIHVSQTLVLLFLSLLLPSSLGTVLAMVVASVSPLTAHWLSLGGGRLAGVTLIVAALSILALSYVCLWMLS